MKKILSILLLGFTLLCNAQNNERLEYILRYGFVVGGKASFTANNTLLNNNETVHFKMEGRTVGLTHAVYAVNDTYESWANPVTFLPQKAIRNIKEKDYRYYNEVQFHHAKDSAYSQKSGWRKIEPNTCDIVSAFFYLRNLPGIDQLSKGEVINLPLWHIDKNTEISIKYMGKETIKTKVGKFKCLHFKPIVEPGKLLKRADSVDLWFTDDEKHIPLMLKFDLKLGSLKCELVEYKSDKTHLSR